MVECLEQAASVRGKEWILVRKSEMYAHGRFHALWLVIYGHMPLGYLDGRNKGSQAKGLPTGREFLHGPPRPGSANGEAIPLFH